MNIHTKLFTIEHSTDENYAQEEQSELIFTLDLPLGRYCMLLVYDVMLKS